MVLEHMAMRGWWLGLLAVAPACSKAPPPHRQASRPSFAVPIVADTVSAAIEDTAPLVDTVLGRCAVALEPPSAEHQEVVDALKTAYGLEDVLFQHGILDTISREEVYAHYRRGFGEDLAQALTDYSWESDRIRATERAMTVPDSVGVLDLKQDRALVAWIPPTAFRTQWGAPRCLVDRLVRENGRWIVQAREP